jgi:hypothetical protein
MKKIALIFIALHLLFSCGAERLHQKAVNKGYVHTIDVDTLKVPYLVVEKIKGKDSLVVKYKDSIVYQLETKYVPKWKVRFDNRRFNDSLKHIRKVYTDSLKAEIKMNSDSLKAEVKIKKQEKRQSKKPNLWLFVIGFGAGFVTKWLLKFSKYTL